MPDEDGGFTIPEDYKKELKRLMNSKRKSTDKETLTRIKELLDSPTYDWWKHGK